MITGGGNLCSNHIRGIREKGVVWAISPHLLPSAYLKKVRDFGIVNARVNPPPWGAVGLGGLFLKGFVAATCLLWEGVKLRTELGTN